jgi:hypothetical protein
VGVSRLLFFFGRVAGSGWGSAWGAVSDFPLLESLFSDFDSTRLRLLFLEGSASGSASAEPCFFPSSLEFPSLLSDSGSGSGCAEDSLSFPTLPVSGLGVGALLLLFLGAPVVVGSASGSDSTDEDSS